MNIVNEVKGALAVAVSWLFQAQEHMHGLAAACAVLVFSVLLGPLVIGPIGALLAGSSLELLGMSGLGFFLVMCGLYGHWVGAVVALSFFWGRQYPDEVLPVWRSYRYPLVGALGTAAALQLLQGAILS